MVVYELGSSLARVYTTFKIFPIGFEHELRNDKVVNMATIFFG